MKLTALITTLSLTFATVSSMPTADNDFRTAAIGCGHLDLPLWLYGFANLTTESCAKFFTPGKYEVTKPCHCKFWTTYGKDACTGEPKYQIKNGDTGDFTGKFGASDAGSYLCTEA